MWLWNQQNMLQLYYTLEIQSTYIYIYKLRCIAKIARLAGEPVKPVNGAGENERRRLDKARQHTGTSPETSARPSIGVAWAEPVCKLPSTQGPPLKACAIGRGRRSSRKLCMSRVGSFEHMRVVEPTVSRWSSTVEHSSCSLSQKPYVCVFFFAFVSRFPRNHKSVFASSYLYHGSSIPLIACFWWMLRYSYAFRHVTVKSTKHVAIVLYSRNTIYIYIYMNGYRNRCRALECTPSFFAGDNSKCPTVNILGTTPYRVRELADAA